MFGLRGKRKQLRNWSSERGAIPTTEHASASWLYSCPPGTATDEIVAQLGEAGAHVYEVIADGWDDEAKAIRDLTESVGGENVHDYNWNALNDGLRDLPEPVLVIVRGSSITGRRPAGERALAAFIGCLDPEMDRPKRVKLVLDGWQHEEVEEITPRAWQADVYRVTPTAGWSPTLPPPNEFRRF